MGDHTPDADLVVISPQQNIFLVDVKGLQKRNAWQIKPKKPRDNLFYILAVVERHKQNEFFILKQSELAEVFASEYQRLDRPADYHRPGFKFSAVESYRDQWKSLPDYPHALPR